MNKTLRQSILRDLSENEREFVNGIAKLGTSLDIFTEDAICLFGTAARIIVETEHEFGMAPGVDTRTQEVFRLFARGYGAVGDISVDLVVDQEP